MNVGAYAIEDRDAPFESRHAAGFRAVYDLDDLSASRFLINTGQSGHVLSSHYRDWAEPWRRGELVPMLSDRAAVEAAGGSGAGARTAALSAAPRGRTGAYPARQPSRLTAPGHLLGADARVRSHDQA